MEETKYVVTVMGSNETSSGVGDIYYFDTEKEANDFYENKEYIADSSGDTSISVMLLKVKKSKTICTVFDEKNDKCVIEEYNMRYIK